MQADVIGIVFSCNQFIFAMAYRRRDARPQSKQQRHWMLANIVESQESFAQTKLGSTLSSSSGYQLLFQIHGSKDAVLPVGKSSASATVVIHLANRHSTYRIETHYEPRLLASSNVFPLVPLFTERRLTLVDSIFTAGSPYGSHFDVGRETSRCGMVDDFL